MTREEAIEIIRQDIPCEHDTDLIEALEMAIKALETEPLTYTEQRVFLAAMGKEENVCRKVRVDNGVDLVTAYYNIERKVKATLWK